MSAAAGSGGGSRGVGGGGASRPAEKPKESSTNDEAEESAEEKSRRLEQLFRKIDRSDRHLNRNEEQQSNGLLQSQSLTLTSSQFDEKSPFSSHYSSSWRISSRQSEGDGRGVFLDYLGVHGDDRSDDPFESLYCLWLNERVAPELLPYDEHTIYRMSSMCQNAEKQNDELKRLTTKSKPTEADKSKIQRLLLEESLQQLQVERVRYLLASYHRTRIRKVEKNVIYYCKTAEFFQRMSNAEQTHATAFTNLLAEYFNKVFLQQRHAHPPHAFVLPREFQGLMEENAREDMVPKPDLDRFVVMRARKEFDFRGSDNAAADDDNSQRLFPGDIFVTRYRLCQQYLKDKKIQFI